MAARQRLICASGELADSADGVRFEVDFGEERAPAFAVRFEGVVYAYLNRCVHMPMELDWKMGKFFDPEGLLLVCSTHGALYQPDSGKCLAGPCAGQLTQIAVDERDGDVYVEE